MLRHMENGTILKKHILFVCTGNIFRSMIAEKTAQHHFPDHPNYHFSSAGTRAERQDIHPVVLEKLLARGLDPRPHAQRKINTGLLKTADLVIAMSTDHKETLHHDFRHPSLLYYEALRDEIRPFPDLWEVVADHETNPEETRRYLSFAADEILTTIPALIERLPRLLSQP